MRLEVAGSLPKDLGLTRPAVKRAARYFAERSRRRVGGIWHEIVVHLVGDEESDALHKVIMGVSGTTDVITQAYDAIPPEPTGLSGELFVNTDQARRAAPRRKDWSPAKELLLYIAHGMDHLSGADDYDPHDYSRMRRRELDWLHAYLRQKHARPTRMSNV